MPIEVKVWSCSGYGCHHRRSDKSKVIDHESRCWKVAENKTCITCKHESIVHDSDGSGWGDVYRDCRHKGFEQVHGNAFDYENRTLGQTLINPRVGCPLWEPHFLIAAKMKRK